MGRRTMSATDTLTRAATGYAPPGEERPLAAYGVLTATFGASLTAAFVALRATGRDLPDGPRASDLLLAGVATHKVSRLLAKDRVTSFVRAPFTRYQEAAGHGEVEEQPRGHGLQLALGELLVCPYCLAQWVAATFSIGLVAAPRATRFIAGIYVAETISDVLQLAYRAAEDRA
jgi:Protein of unknown function (DUF1360)